MKISDTNKLLYDVYLRDEESAGEVLLAAAGAVAEEGEPDPFLATLAAECTKRGIDPMKAMGKVFEKRNRLFGLFNSNDSIPMAGGGFSMPIKVSAKNVIKEK